MNLYKSLVINGVEFKMYADTIKIRKGINWFRFVFFFDGYLIWHDMAISNKYLEVIDDETHPDRESLIPIIYEPLMICGKRTVDKLKLQST